MPEYVTPERFKTMGTGVDLAEVEDFELRSILRRASDRVNAITAAPYGHDFRGGSVVNEEHPWNPGNGVSVQAERSVFLHNYPIVSVSKLHIRLTNTQYIAFQSNELYVTERFVEITSLAMTSIGLFGAFIVPEIGLAHPRSSTDYVYGQTFAKTGEGLDQTDGKTWRAQDQWWDDSETVTVYVDGVEKSASEYTINYDEGTIEITTPIDGLPAGSVVTADYTTKLGEGIATATSILAAEALSDAENRRRGMAGLRSLRVGEIALEKDQTMRGSQTLATPAQLEAETYLNGWRFFTAMGV